MKKVLVLLLGFCSVIFSAQEQKENQEAKKNYRITCGCKSKQESAQPVIVLDEKVIPYQIFNKIQPELIKSLSVVKGENASQYGEKAVKNGAIKIELIKSRKSKKWKKRFLAKL